MGNMRLSESNRAIVVLSNDKNKDLWQCFADVFYYAWPKCPYKIYFITNVEPFNFSIFTNILTGPRTDWQSDWAPTYRRALESITEKYLLVLMDDFLITKPDEKLISIGFDILHGEKLGTLHTQNLPRLKRNKYPKSAWGLYDSDQPYICNVSAFWNKDVLSKLLVDGENPWDFEILGSRRLGRISTSGALFENCIPYVGIVDKGRFIRNLDKEIKHLSLPFDLPLERSSRKSQNKYSPIPFIKKTWFLLLLNYTPFKWRIQLISSFRKFLVGY